MNSLGIGFVVFIIGFILSYMGAFIVDDVMFFYVIAILYVGSIIFVQLYEINKKIK